MNNEFGHNETVVSPTFCSADSLGHSDVMSVLFANDDVVDQMPVFRSWVHPGRLLVIG